MNRDVVVESSMFPMQLLGTAFAEFGPCGWHVHCMKPDSSTHFSKWSAL